jgi:hypothetical protein
VIYIYAPAYVSISNGIRVHYTLVEILNKIGIEARLLSYEKRRNDYIVPKSVQQYVVYLNEKNVHISKNDVVVYPEIIHDNPLNATKIVRYLLNRPGVLTGRNIKYNDTDYIVAYSQSIDKCLPQLFIMNDDRKEILISKVTAKQDSVCLYFGKVNKNKLYENVLAVRPIIKKFKKVEIITRMHPGSREELFKKIAHAQLLISFDPLTNLTYEATLLGTPVLLADTSMHVENDFNIPLYGIFSSYEDLKSHLQDVELAFAEYERHLEKRGITVKTWVNDFFRHFERLESHDSMYLMEHSKVIEEVSRKFDVSLNSFEYKLQGLENINIPIELDTKIILIFNLRTKMTLLQKKLDYRSVLRTVTKKIGIYETLRRIRGHFQKKCILDYRSILRTVTKKIGIYETLRRIRGHFQKSA